jgi:selenocysteine lyase/cysteine desulfurase
MAIATGSILESEATAPYRPRHRPVVASVQLEETRASFLAEFPSFADTAHVDELRRYEYSRVDAAGQVYLDYAGGGLYANCQVRAHARMLGEGVFGNPHSLNPTSSAMTELVERARARVLDFFGASPEEYDVVFTANASGALRLVGEAYPFAPGDRFLLLIDNHNSVNGIREFARARGARTTCVPCPAPDLRLDASFLARNLAALPAGRRGLFAYPAQSNFSGVRHSLDWVEEAQAHGWHVVVDCAAFVPTSRLDLARCQPDFVPISFYKLFGYPTGVGCLLARHDALACLARPWFAGGTITAVSAQGDWHRMAPGHTAFEDGTVNYLSIPAVEIGLDWIDHVGVPAIERRVQALGAWLHDSLGRLRHSNGRPAVAIYGPGRWEERGATMALNFLTPDGRVVDERIIDRTARDQKLSLRTGCFCNPGAGEAAFGLSPADVALDVLPGRMELSIDDYIDAIGLPSAGAIRVSLGLASNFDDVYRFVQFAHTFLDRESHAELLPARTGC